MPDIAIRSSFIAGFPGEREDDFKELESFLNESKLDRVGVFEYSREEDTEAYNFKEQIDEEEKRNRFERLMMCQEEISEKKLENHLDRIMEVIIDEIEAEGIYIGRSYLDAPEVDGVVYVYSDVILEVGAFYKVKITDNLQHDLISVFSGEESLNEHS